MHDEFFCIVQELCEGGDLSTYIDRVRRDDDHIPQGTPIIVTHTCHPLLCVVIRSKTINITSCVSYHSYCTTEEVLRWFTQICGALDYIHNMGVLHRDLKSSNIFLSKGRTMAKIGDFGISCVLASTLSVAKTFTGYMKFIFVLDARH